MNKKKILKILIIIISIFILLNGSWLIVREVKYKPYKQNLTKSVMSTFIVPRYTTQDEDGFTYALKYPDYMALSSNLSVSLPVADDNPYVDSLIIWISIFDKKIWSCII